MHQENRADKHTPCVTRTASGRPLDSTRSSACCSVMTWGGGEAREGGDVRVHTADSRCCAAETNTTLESKLYSNFKNTVKKKKGSGTDHSDCKAPEAVACLLGFRRAQNREQSSGRVRIVYKCFKYKYKAYVIYKFLRHVQIWASPGGSAVKNLPAVQEPQESWAQSPGSPGEGHGNPLQYSGLQNPMDRGAWRAVHSIHSIAKSRTQMKRLGAHICTHLHIKKLTCMYLCVKLCQPVYGGVFLTCM